MKDNAMEIPQKKLHEDQKWDFETMISSIEWGYSVVVHILYNIAI